MKTPLSLNLLYLRGVCTMKDCSKLFLVVAVTLSVLCTSSRAGPTLELVSTGSSGYIGNAFFQQVNTQPTGSGVIDPFVRLQTNDTFVSGYNTSYRPLEFDENNASVFTRDLHIGSIPTVMIDGLLYREFLLDINQEGNESGRYLSLDAIKIYIDDTAGNYGYGANPSNLGTLIYDLDGLDDNRILLDYRLNYGSGSGDMLAYIPNELFVGGQFVYLYSEFGNSTNPLHWNNAGFEEWAVRESTQIPAPGSLILASIGISLVGWFRRKRIMHA